MSRSLLPSTLAAVLVSGTAVAEAPTVAVDIAPVHSLVARVMEGIGTPDLIVPPGATPHAYSLRPSEAQALQDADLVVWTGEGLTPWLPGSVETLAGGAVALELMDVPGTERLSMREGAVFEAHDHHDESGHDDGHEHGHEHEHEHEQGEAEGDHDAHDVQEGAEDHDHDHDHDHGAFDAHAWLSPDNAVTWLDAIAEELSAADPEHAEAYRANAAAGRSEIEMLRAEIDGTLAPLRGRAFIVFHDAYQYFETSFDIPASGAISLSDAVPPSPARIAEIRDRVAGAGVSCVLSEPQFNPAMVQTVLDGTEARSAVLDPLGADLEPGPTLYPQLLRSLAQALADCL